MYQNNVAVAVKVNGKVLREQGDIVALPFGSEYSILVKNINSVRAQVKISVDGTDATDGTHLVIGPNASIELERFIKGGNLNAGNRFKFIERTGKIEDHRGIGAEDGLIRVETWKEKAQPILNLPIVHYYDEWYPRPKPYYPPSWPWYPPYHYTYGSTSNSMIGSSGQNSANTTGGSMPLMKSAISTSRTGPKASGGNRGSVTRSVPLSASLGGQRTNSNRSVSAMNLNIQETSVEHSDAGITIAGSESQQQFRSVSGFTLESASTVIVLRLKGELGNKTVSIPVTVKAKAKCEICGKSNKANTKFCAECGAALLVIA